MYPSLTTSPGDLFGDFEALTRQVERLFGTRAFPASIRAADRGAFPAINMGSTRDGVEIYAFAPGIDPGKIDLTVGKGLLTIAGERATQSPAASDKVSVYAQERFEGPFKRVVSLPEDVDTARVDATYRDGILKIAIARREASKPRRIEVTA